MLGTQVQKVRVTFCPDAAEEDEDEPLEAVVEDEPPEEQPATSAASATPAIAVARTRRRGLTSFIDPPQ
jgi:hypothetical protein